MVGSLDEAAFSAGTLGFGRVLRLVVYAVLFLCWLFGLQSGP